MLLKIRASGAGRHLLRLNHRRATRLEQQLSLAADEELGIHTDSWNRSGLGRRVLKLIRGPDSSYTSRYPLRLFSLTRIKKLWTHGNSGCIFLAIRPPSG
jgi:hypothetical protein